MMTTQCSSSIFLPTTELLSFGNSCSDFLEFQNIWTLKKHLASPLVKRSPCSPQGLNFTNVLVTHSIPFSDLHSVAHKR